VCFAWFKLLKSGNSTPARMQGKKPKARALDQQKSKAKMRRPPAKTR